MVARKIPLKLPKAVSATLAGIRDLILRKFGIKSDPPGSGA
jgi:hypothetical protein